MDYFLATNIKFLRNKNKLTQAELAKKLNKDYTTVGKWEQNQRNPMMEDLFKISILFNIGVQDLMYKDLRFEKPEYDELDLLYENNKKYLTESDKTLIKTIIENRIKEIDKVNNNE